MHESIPSDSRPLRRVAASYGTAAVAATWLAASSCTAIAAPPRAASSAGEFPAEDAAPLWPDTSELDPEALVEAVLARNPDLAAMRAASEAAAAAPSRSRALDDPRFAYGLAPATIGEPDFDLGQSFELSQRIPWPGKRATRGEAADREAEAAIEDLSAARLRLTATARQTFYEWWYLHRALEIQDSNLALLDELRDAAETRYAAGLASKQDALQAEVEHQRSRHRDVVLRRRLEVARARLNALLDRPSRDPVPPPPSTLPSPSPVSSLDVLESRAIESRPSLRAERRRIESRRADVRRAELDFLPDFTLSGGYSSLWEADELRPIVGVAVDLPIRLEPRRAALGRARAELRRAEARLAREAAEVRLEVDRALEELRENEHVVRLYAESIVPATEERLAAARSGYETATNDFHTLIQAEKDLLTAELTEREALAAYHGARARLERAVGLPLAELEDRP